MTGSLPMDQCRKSIFSDRNILAVILVLAALLRIYGTFDFGGYDEDEDIHVPSAISLAEYGTTTSMNWPHPHLSSLMLYGTIKLFGNNPYGWRSGNVILGTASILLLYLLGRRLYPSGRSPLLASALLALDSQHIYFSRTTFVEIPVTFFFMLYLYFMLEFSERHRNLLPLAGIALGLTVATKAYFVLAIPAAAIFVLFRAYQDGRNMNIVLSDFLFCLVLLPSAIYLFSYIQWFGRGYTLMEFITMKLDAVWMLQNYRPENFLFGWFLEAGGRPWEWFLKPTAFGHQLFSDPERGRYLLQINNFPFRLLVIPSLFIAAGCALKRRALPEILPAMLFMSCFILFVGVRRQMFSYSALVALPFAYLLVAGAVGILSYGRKGENIIPALFISAAVAWGLYTFPLVSGVMINKALYAPILSIARLVGVP